MRRFWMIGITLLILTPILNADILEKKAIVKLIDQNTMLLKKVNNISFKLLLLEHKIKVLSHSKPVKASTKKQTHFEKLKQFKILKVQAFYYRPKVTSFVRKDHFLKAKKVIFALPAQQIKISKLACYKDIGFWGKSDKGWIYISNPKYGDILSIDGKTKLSQKYSDWCEVSK